MVAAGGHRRVNDLSGSLHGREEDSWPLSCCEGGVGVGADGPARSDDGGPIACLLAKGGRRPGDWQDARRMILRMGAAARCHGHDHGLFTLSYLIVSTYVDNYPKGSVEQNQILFGIRGRPHLQSKSQHK